MTTDRAELDEAYANAAFIPGAEAFPPMWAAKARAFRERHGTRTLDHGRGAREALDLFLPDGAADGCMIFVHGGYWLRFGREDWSHLAAGALARGVAVAMPSYPLCPEARISDISRSVAAAVTRVAEEVKGPLWLTGHSAGGQQVCRMVAPGVLPEAVRARVAGVMPISPVADLRPLTGTSMNDGLRLDAAEAAAESPLLAPPPRGVPVTVLVGAAERPVFLADARALAEAWGARLIEAEGKHHFDVIEALEDPESAALKALLA